ncbi:CapA family protein [uncultured Parabacteroides sp.]|uniref:CapA family protein n=1 Tax=uncultured Parabacteroides sp. TaxID=512312 RepID=UPI0026597855|nr:CapA family protein [uncultured Parabacteroides sp.]
MNNQVSLLFAGDIMLGENLYHIGRGIRTKYQHSYDSFIPSCIKKTLFTDIDAFIYNFEYSLVSNDYPFTDFEGSIYASTVDSLKALPKDLTKVVNIANNHFWQHEIERTQFSIDMLKKHGYYVAGESNKPTIVKIKSKTLHVWGVSLVDDHVPVFTSTYEQLLADLTLPEHKGENDIWVISIHWGTEFISYPNKSQVDLAHKLVAAGFDIVHGHHPHVCQPIEFVGNSIIMYSLGNCIFDENFAKKTQLAYMPKLIIGDKIVTKMYLMHNKNYVPYKVETVDYKSIEFIPNKYWSERKKRLVFKKYNVLRKLEFLPHIAENGFYIYKNLKIRRKAKNNK